jgi:hypothetical protein
MCQFANYFFLGLRARSAKFKQLSVCKLYRARPPALFERSIMRRGLFLVALAAALGLGNRGPLHAGPITSLRFAARIVPGGYSCGFFVLGCHIPPHPSYLLGASKKPGP